MQRLIPNKTKVHVELFRGIYISDFVVGGLGVLLLILVIISNLPFKFGICLTIAALTALLITRIDDQPNYILFLHVLSFLGYRRHFKRRKSRENLIGEDEEASGKAPAYNPKKDMELLKSSLINEEEKEKARARIEQGRRAQLQAAALKKDIKKKRAPMTQIMPFTKIKDGLIEYLGGEYYGAAIEIDPVDFRFFSEHRRNNSIENCFGRILRSINIQYAANIVKIERPIIYDRYLEREYEKLDSLKKSFENGMLSEEELKSRVEIQYDRINDLRDLCEQEKVVTSFFYLVLYEANKRQLEVRINDAVQLLTNGELRAKRLNDNELAVFLKYSNQIDFDEREVERVDPENLHLWAMPEVVDITPRRVEVNHIITHNFRVTGFPTTVGDAWLAGVMSIPSTKVIVKCRPMDRVKSIRNIDRSLMELRDQLNNTGIDSKRMEIETHIDTLQELLATLQDDSEVLLECNIYVTAYDISMTRANSRLVQPPPSDLSTMAEMKKNIRRTWKESGFRLNNMEFDQVQAFIGSQVSGLDPVSKDGRGISSNTVAGSYPWIFAHISDEGGIKLGETDGIPVFVDFFRRDSERVNSNMVIVGKSGSGKSYATKSLLANLAAEDAKIFILDPENEYTDLARNLNGQVINVGNAQFGRLNPFHIITALDDDETEGGPSGSYATHLQFLEEFFRQIMPDCDRDAMEYLNNLVDHMYMSRNITAQTDLSKLSPEDYPVFDDLYDEVLQEFQSSDNPFTRDLLRTLMNYVAKFSAGGRNANIWNGPSTVTTDENFTVFNFQSMLANRNTTIANAQMLLVLKYVDNEIIKNRDYNIRYHASRKIVVVIDEAHVFIDNKFPVALDFMYQLAKRIRKYNGMQIVITQNIKDFVGSEELARKSTAIINACQYSFIFALAPNDIQDLVKLYENAGGINESEQEEIIQAPRGQAFAIMSPSSRSTFRVETSDVIKGMFEDMTYQSEYFSDEEGFENWEEFVANSREAHDAAVAGRRKPSRILEERPVLSIGSGSGVSLNIIDADEMESEEDEYDYFADEKTEEEKQPVAVMPVQNDPEPQPAAMAPGSMEVFSAIANALSRMADAAEKGETSPLVSAARSYTSASSEDDTLSEKERELERKQRELDEMIKKLREENERLRSGALQPEDTGEDDEDIDDDTDLFSDEDEDDFGEEEEGGLSALLEDDLDSDEDEDFDDEDEDEDEDEDDFDDDSDDDEDEDEDEDDYDDYDYDDEDDDDDDSSDDFMSSFCSFAASLMNMSPFERMAANGRLVEEITLDDLIAEAAAQYKRARERRAQG